MRLFGIQLGAGAGSGRMYELLGLAGQNAVAIARAVEQRFREHPSSSVTQEQVKDLEHEGDRLSAELFRCIQAQFQPPYDRDDIVELVFAVDEVADKIENASELLGLYGVDQPTRQALELCGCLVRATEELAALLGRMKGLRGSAAEVRTIKAIEDEADQVARNARAGLFKDDRIDPVLVIRWKDIYESLEDAVDACDTAANRIGNILVKNT
jgi:predicted phosphate transport protein (TIGR00153 family)